MNQIKMSDRATFVVNSANRLSGTNGKFAYQIQLDLNVGYDRVAVLSANIPKTWYQIQDGLNTFELVEGMSMATITIPVGSYTRNSFATVLKTLLNAGSPNAWTYSVAIPNILLQADTGKYTYSVTGNGAVQPSFVLGGNNIYKQMGFSPSTTYTFTSNSLVSLNVCNFASEACLFLKSDMCYNILTGDNVLQEIYPGGTGYNSYIPFTNINPELNARTLVNKSNVYNFYLTDENGVDLTLNGINMVFTVLVWRSSRFESLVDNFIKWKVNRGDGKQVVPLTG